MYTKMYMTPLNYYILIANCYGLEILYFGIVEMDCSSIPILSTIRGRNVEGGGGVERKGGGVGGGKVRVGMIEFGIYKKVSC